MENTTEKTLASRANGKDAVVDKEKAAGGQATGGENKGVQAADGEAAVGDKQELAVPVSVVMQYVKDLSFENPHAPESLVANDVQPTINVSVNVSARNLRARLYEVELKLSATASRGEQRIFMVETNYAGVFELGEFDEKFLRPVLLIECPRLMFPFARAVVAEATRDGGFPPLMIQPVDFVGMYQKDVEGNKEAEPAQPASLQNSTATIG